MQEHHRRTDPNAEATISLDIEASPEDVWRSLTTDEGLAAWLGDGSTMGAEPGDDLFVTDVVTGEPKQGRVDEIERGERLVYSWWPDQEPDSATRVAITLVRCVSGTRVTVVEARPGMAEARASTSANWAWRTALLSLAATTMTLLPVCR